MRSSLFIASFVLGALASPSTVFSGALRKRQGGGNVPSFPTECQSSCQKIENALQQCSDDNCFCTSSNIQAFAQCLQCAANASGEVSNLQDSLDGVIQACDQEGFNVPNETLTGGGSGGGLPPATGGSSPTFSSPAQTGSNPSGSGNNPTGAGNPFGGSNTTPVPTSTAGSGSGGSNPLLGGNTKKGGAVANGVSTLAFTLIGGMCLAIAAL